VVMKVAAGVTSGGVAAAICNPTELIKVTSGGSDRRDSAAGGGAWGVGGRDREALQLSEVPQAQVAWGNRS
jgi:hypothetical protein